MIQLKVGLTQALKRQLQQESEARHVSMSSLVRLVLSEYLRAKGGSYAGD